MISNIANGLKVFITLGMLSLQDLLSLQELHTTEEGRGLLVQAVE